ncbi:MAG: energy transducer TonB [Saprospiraceae bacterium]|nr:energy transducer TonB [Saprospiraceae bacterium]
MGLFRHVLLLSLLFLTIPSSSAQSESTEKAMYSEGAVSDILRQHIKYPTYALQNNISGDVIFSVTMTPEGKLDSVRLVTSPAPVLTKASHAGFEHLIGRWKNIGKDNGKKADSYLFVFRYRRYLDGSIPAPSKKVHRLIEKEKWQKALKITDEWLIDDAYNVDLWRYRSTILKALKDHRGKSAENKAINLAQDILANVLIVVLGQTDAETTPSTTIRYKN